MRSGKQRVLHIVTALDFGGVEKHMETIARNAADGRFEHCFCALAGGGAAEQALRAAGARVWLLDVPAAIPSWRAVCAAYGLLKQLRPAVVHTHGAEANFHGLLAAWLAGAPVRIGEEIGIPQHSARARFVFRQVYRTATRVIGISDSVVHCLDEIREVAKERLVRLYNPVEPSPIDGMADAERNGPLRLCQVGRLHPIKNLPVLLEAVAQVKAGDEECELWLIGDGVQRVELEEKVRDLGLERWVRFLGYQREPGRFLAQCDVLVQVSRAEGFGLALVEGLQAGLPAIVTRIGGGPEIVEQGKTGWLVSPDSVQEIAGAIREAQRLGRPGLQEMGEAASRSVEGRFSPTAYLCRLEALYRSLLAGGARGEELIASGERL